MVKSIKNQPRFKCYSTLIAILIIAVILGGLLLAFTMNRNIIMENFSQNKISIEYFCMTGCPFCDKFEDTWTKFKNYVDNSDTVLSYTYKKYNISTSEGETRGKLFNVNSAPTILAIKDDKVLNTMTKNRTLENLKEFAKENSTTSN